jgi:dTDP-4-dehydrorhamnose reductase
MKILITGAGGQLGRDCTRSLSAGHVVTALDLPEIDITIPDQVDRALTHCRPDVVLNCAAYTRVDDCEDHRDEAWRLNAVAPGILAEAANRCGARLVHLSTDYVFDGLRPTPRPYTEDDPPHPSSWYGQSKLGGEAAVQNACRRWTILRTAWLYGRHGSNFPKTMLRLALRDPAKPIRVVNEQYGSPTWSWRLAEQIRTVIEADAQGLFHATAEGYGTWFELAAHFLSAMQVPHVVQPCRIADYPTRAVRPVNSILENARLKQASLNIMRDWRADLDEYVARYRVELLAEGCQQFGVPA